jgi:hypothetical protein
LLSPEEQEVRRSAQAAPQPPTFPNYSIMLVNPAGGGVVLMHNPKNGMEYVDVAKTQDAFKAGYVPVRVAEIADVINYLRSENERLTAENARVKGSPATPSPVIVIAPQAQPAAPTQAEIDAQERAQASARRQQIILSFMMMQNANRPQPYQPQAYQLPMMPVNPNPVRAPTNCTTQRIGDTSYTNCN